MITELKREIIQDYNENKEQSNPIFTILEAIHHFVILFALLFSVLMRLVLVLSDKLTFFLLLFFNCIFFY